MERVKIEVLSNPLDSINIRKVFLLTGASLVFIVCHNSIFNQIFYRSSTLYGLRHKKTCLRGFANNTGADQPAHPRSLISTFVILFLEGIIM